MNAYIYLHISSPIISSISKSPEISRSSNLKYVPVDIKCNISKIQL